MPASPDAGEDEGWLVGLVVNTADDTTEFAVLDAQSFEAAPSPRSDCRIAYRRDFTELVRLGRIRQNRKEYGFARALKADIETPGRMVAIDAVRSRDKRCRARRVEAGERGGGRALVAQERQRGQVPDQAAGEDGEHDGRGGQGDEAKPARRVGRGAAEPVPKLIGRRLGLPQFDARVRHRLARAVGDRAAQHDRRPGRAEAG